MRPEHDSFAILDAALNAAGAPEADAVFVSTDQNISRFANSNLHQNMSEISAELTLRIIVDDAMGVASTTVFDADEIARTAALAREAARHSDPLQNFSGLYRESEPLPSVHTFDEATAAIAPADKARALREMFDRGRKLNTEFAGAYGTGASSVAVANTHGIRRYCTMTASDATVIAIGTNGSGYATEIDRRNVDVVSLGDEATVKAILGADVLGEIEPGPYDVILEPAATAEVADWLNMITLSGSAFDDGSSFFVNNIGKQVLGANFTLADDSVDDVFLPFPFDLEGLPKRRVTLIERGIVRTPAVDKAYADRLGFTPTATCWSLGGAEHGSAFHLSIDGGDATREDLIRSTKRGIWVTRFNYVNGLLEPKTALMTGTTRDGTFLIRDGEVVSRLPNLRWTQSIVEAFSRIEGLTRERRRVATWYNPFGGTIAPVMKIAGWNFA
ncbi:MAG TPA: metallopeptidase TldD-related protein [Thermoanaerobaculia bacterium]|jgi:PmbA protein|nr:metallopeptidase TldD-related protein [Thermoanaerobaculia bacterium]